MIKLFPKIKIILFSPMTHDLLLGHPFPLKGRYVALIFIHFEPTGHSLGKNESGFFYIRHDDKKRNKKDRHELEKEYRKATINGHGGQSSSMGAGLPPYIKRMCFQPVCCIW